MWADFSGGEVWLLFCDQEGVFFSGSPSAQGRFQLDRDERASLAAEAKDGLQLTHELNELFFLSFPALEQ